MSLTILSASAGSGKTYRLSREYVNICLSHRDPTYAGSMLAMTFTNKATEEMKMRILELFAKIAYGSFSPDETDLLYPLHSQLGASEMQARADSILKFLLKNYHQFSVSTIDSFFQKVIRQFQRELHLDQPFNVEMNTDRVLNAAVQKLLESLVPGSPEFKWVLEWISDNLDEGDNWDVRKDLRTLGNELLKEGVTDQWGELDLEEMDTLLNQLKQFVKDLDRRFDAIKERLNVLLSSVQMSPLDFSYSSTGFMSTWLSCNTFDLLRTKKRFNEVGGFPDSWFSKKVEREYRIKVSPVEDEILSLWSEVREMLESKLPAYLACKAAIKTFRTYIALRFLYQSLKDYCSENDLLLLSESNKLMSKVVSGTDISLLYEKSGQRYRHILVDEFQDTSGAQWNNLKPLYENALSVQQDCLIVGDIKQAIYRWRNGNWQIMHSEVEKDLAHFSQNIQKIPLENNWRSAREIVDFNNALYKKIVPALKAHVLTDWLDHDLIPALDTIYKDVAQNCKIDPKKHGHVEVDILPYFEKNKDVEDDEDSQNDKYERYKIWLSDKLNDLYASGYNCSDICVLVRTSKEAERVMNWLHEMEYQDHHQGRYEAISENGFLLKYNAAIQLLIHALAVRCNPKNKSLVPQLEQFWQMTNKEIGSALIKAVHANEFVLPRELSIITTSHLDTLSGWFSMLIREWQLGDSSPYHLSTFLDYVRQFELKEGNDPGEFMDWWHSNEQKLGVASDGNKHAIQVMTIHKSKGIQFPVVLLPFTDFKLIEFKPKEILYVKNDTDPLLKQLGNFPVHGNSDLEFSSFSNDFIRERILKSIDNLNLLYVATTRPEQCLFIAVEETKPDKNSELKVKTIGDLLQLCLPENTSDTVTNKVDSAGRKKYSPWPDEDKPKVNTQSLNQLTFRKERLKTGVWLDKPLPVISPSDAADQSGMDARGFGIIIHEVLERIKEVSEWPEVMSAMIHEGKLTEENQKLVGDKIRHFLNHDQVKTWYAKDQNIYVEKEIIEVDGKSYRPDRVILQEKETILIDFKTGHPSVGHVKQLKKYMAMLKAMDLPNVTGWLAYIETLEFQNITD